MLKILIPEGEAFDPLTNSFIHTKAQTLTLEHSLVSISKWESKWHKPFFPPSTPQLKDKFAKTLEESRDYVRCMTLTQNVDPEIYNVIDQKAYDQIRAYMDDPMSATWFNSLEEDRAIHKGQVVTSEIIYYWMVTFGIPFECQKWHINRLLTLINVCSEKNKPAKKRSKRSISNQYASLNAARKKALNTRG